ncbi:MAG: hypothetical protein ACREBQ_07830 [Nitrososphaerales archaeon]
MNKWFPLPRVGSECFAELRRASVAYDSKFGFKFTSGTDVQRALSALSAALGEGFELQSSCFICDGPTEDSETSGGTLCQRCATSEDAYALYTMKFARLMEQA